MNTKLILLAVCYRHHWYLRRGRISPARGNLSLLANRKEGRKEETRCGRISQTKGCATASVIECYALRRQRARYPLVDRRWSIHLTWRFVTRLEYLEEKIKRNWKKKNRETPFYILSRMWKVGNETKISICVDMHPREPSLVALVMHRSQCCVFFDNETGRTGQL